MEIEADASAISDVQTAIDDLDTDIAVGIDADASEAVAAVGEVEDAAPDGIDIPVSLPGVEEAEQEVGGLTDSVEGLQGALAGIGAVGAGAAISEVVGAFAEAERVGSVTGQILDNVGTAAGVTAADVNDLALSVQEYSGISDEAVTAAAGLVAGFENIRNSGDQLNFDRTIEQAANLSVVFGQDLPSAARTLGRALADPEKAAARLRRTGIILSESQQAAISSFLELGDVASAQGVILDAIETKYGGVAEAAGATLSGSLDRAKEAFGNIAEVIGGSIASGLDPFVSGIAGLAERFTALPQPVQNVAGALAAFTLAAGTAAASAVALKAAVGSDLAASLAASAKQLTGLATSAAAFAVANPAVAVGALVVALGGLAVATGNAEGTERALADLNAQVSELAVQNAEALASLDALGEGVLQVVGALVDLSVVLQQVNSLSIELGDSGTSLFQLFATAAPAIDGISTLFGELSPKGAEAAGGLKEVAAAEAEVEANAQALLSTLPSVASGFDDVLAAAPGLAEAFGIVNAESNPQILAENLQAQADLLNAWSADLTTVAEEGPAGLANTLRDLGPEAAGLTAQLADALNSGDVVEAARLAGAISNLEDAQGRITGLGTSTGSGFSDAASSAIETGGQAVGAAAQATGDAAAAGIGAGFGTVTALLTAQMGLATATVSSTGAVLVTTSGTVGRNAGTALSQGFLATAPALIGLAMSSVSIRISSASFAVASSARSAGAGIGRALGQGIRAGIDETVSEISQAARNAVLDAADAARAAAQVSSPSKVWTEIGSQMGAGMAVGLAQAQADVVRAAESITFAAAQPVAAASSVGGGTATFGGVNVNVRIDNATPEGAVAVGRAVRDGVSQAIQQQRQAFDVRTSG